MTAGTTYREVPDISAQELADLFRSSGIRRPVDDLPRLEKRLTHANLMIGAYHDGHALPGTLVFTLLLGRAATNMQSERWHS